MATMATIPTIANETVNGVHANAKRFNTFIMCIAMVSVRHRARLDTGYRIERRDERLQRGEIHVPLDSSTESDTGNTVCTLAIR